MQDVSEEFEKRGVELVAISRDEPALSVELAQRLEITLPLLSDIDLDVINAYWVKDPDNDFAWPSIFIVAPDGTIVWRDIAVHFKNRPAPEIVLEALDQLEEASDPPS